MEEQLAKLDEEREREAVASRELVEEQKQVMFEARQSALSEMEAKLAARKKHMSEQVYAERRRCEVVRRRELRKAEDNQQEVLRCKKHISELSSAYRRRRYRCVAASTPRSNVASPVDPSRPFASPAPFWLRE